MFGKLTPRVVAAWVLALCFAVAPSSAAPQGKEKKKAKKPDPTGAPVLWREPADIARRDLFNGPGGEALRPDLRKITFIEQETGGFSTKYRVRDAAGRVWVAKVGPEAQSETAAVRLVWGVGYATEINYLAPCVRIEGAPQASDKLPRCGDGGFANVRFEARPEEFDRLDEWRWDENPFKDTKELKGLVVLMALLNNWDLKDSNNKVIYVPANGGELHYVVSDLGATFGKTGSLPLFWRITRSRNNPEDYAKASFIEDVKDGQVYFRYGGKNQDLFDDIQLEEAQWIGRLLSRLSDKQISDAFRAANYSAEDVRLLTEAVRSRIDELAELGRPTAARTR
ncbi:MAG TPA: hypothetical protein VFX96_12560 [Pyrinomonadaceae bacterium]|nr:hypothetical protein [Pyrinomonadaceae bacterium]